MKKFSTGSTFFYLPNVHFIFEFGLGVYHAKRTIESFGGTFEMHSQGGEGTMVHITLPRIDAPKWFVEKLKLSAQTQLISVDDDMTIHQLWDQRLRDIFVGAQSGDEAVQASQQTGRHISFTSTKEFMQWYRQQQSEARQVAQTRQANDHQDDFSPPQTLSSNSAIYLIDYEFLGDKKSGLDLIEELGLISQSQSEQQPSIEPQSLSQAKTPSNSEVILVTSHYDEQDLQQKCLKLGIGIIPKSMAGYVPLELEIG